MDGIKKRQANMIEEDVKFFRNAVENLTQQTISKINIYLEHKKI